MIGQLTKVIDRAVSSRHFLLLGSVLVTALGALFRFGNLANPGNLIFDETYYVKDAWTLGQTGSEKDWPDNFDPSFEAGDFTGYTDVSSYVVHPPIGKWVIYLGMWLFGADSSFGWRFSVALLGTLAIPLIIATAKLLLRSNKFAVLAGLFLAIEGHSIVMSRTSVLDGILAFFVLLGFFFVVLDQERLPDVEKALTFRPWLFFAGTSFGLAAGTKWSGLYFLAAFGLLTLLLDISRRAHAGVKIWPAWLQAVLNAITMLVAAISVYVLSWLGWILSTDGWGRNAKPSWWESLWEYHLNAYRFHTGLGTDHPYQSNALQWLVSARPTAFFFEKYEDCSWLDSCTVAITAVPNMAIWIGGVIAAFWASYRALHRSDKTAALIATGFLAGWAPWLIYLERTTFQFYTVVFSAFLVLALSYALQRYLKRGYGLRLVTKRSRVIVGFVLFTMLLGLYFGSIWMGLEVPHWVWQIQMWFPFWV
ncbi:MAG: hypothetical protein RLZZ249_181 [Actinomycetota bacterium]